MKNNNMTIHTESCGRDVNKVAQTHVEAMLGKGCKDIPATQLVYGAGWP
jgi:hypothetical protein